MIIQWLSEKLHISPKILTWLFLSLAVVLFIIK